MRAPNRSHNRIRAGLRISAAGLVVGLATVSSAVLPAQMANAATLSVTNCSDSGAGSLRAAVAAATSKSTITFASTVTSCSPILLTSGPIAIANNVTIDGPGASSLAVSGDGLVGVFSVSSGVTDATISGLTIENGNAGSGANGANDNVSIPGNKVTEDVDAGDNGGDGGGIYNTGSLAMSNSTTTGNATEVGTFGANGGGIYNDGTATITASTVSANSAGGGGGISFDGSTLTLTDTIVANSPSGGNCAYAGGTVIDGGYNLDSGTTCGLTGSGDENNVSPQLGPLQANGGPTDTMAPASTSPAVDAIPPGVDGCGKTLTTDQRGALRPNGSGCDIGAYEYGDIAMQTLAAKPNPVRKASGLTYTATVSNAGATAATGVTVTDTLPKGEKFKSAKASEGSCSTTATKVTCTLGQVEAAATATVTIVVTVTAKEGKTLSNTATVSASSGDTIPSNDSKTARVTVS